MESFVKKILVSLLVFHSLVVLAEEKEEFGLFERYYTSKPLLSRLTGSDRGTLYIGRLSDDKNLSLSLPGYMGYGIMKCWCKLGHTIMMDGEVDGKHVKYVCSPDQAKVDYLMTACKEMIQESMRRMGETLKRGNILLYNNASSTPIASQDRSKIIELGSDPFSQVDKDVKEIIFVSCANLTQSNIDSTKLGYIVSQKLKKSEYGLFVIDGNLVKMVAVQKGRIVQEFEILPTEEELAEAKSILSK